MPVVTMMVKPHQQRHDSPSNVSRSNSLLYLVLVAFALFALGINISTHSLFLLDHESLLSSAAASSSRNAAFQALSNFVDPDLLYIRPSEPVTIGYAVSLIKCSDKQTTPEGIIDAALVLRHSIHLVHASSQHYPNYKMYAFVHPDAVPCSDGLRDAGFTVRVHASPVAARDIAGDFLRNHIDKEWCCGSAEFMKLYAYRLTDVAIVVHMDMDFLLLQPMEHVYDAMLYDAQSEIGQTARQQLELEFPPASTTTKTTTVVLPERIDAMMTRDWPQVMPGRKAGFQAGFLIVKPNPGVFDLIVDVIRQGDYVDGYGRDNGWSGMGYGVFVGAMAMQGLLAFVYDALLYDTWVELNQCRFNHIGMDVRYRAAPSFRKNHPKVGQCRNDRDSCEDCMVTPLSDIYSVHFNQCRKPWNCIGSGSRELPEDKFAIPQDQVHLDHCLELVTEWHRVRTDLETKLQQQQQHVGLSPLSNSKISASMSGDYKTLQFQGHCMSYGGGGYLRLAGGDVETLRRIPELYQ